MTSPISDDQAWTLEQRWRDDEDFYEAQQNADDGSEANRDTRAARKLKS